jgi:hypothetical protein
MMLSFLADYWPWFAAVPVWRVAWCVWKADVQRGELLDDLDADLTETGAMSLNNALYADMKKVGLVRHAWRLMTFRNPWRAYSKAVRMFREGDL